MNREFVKKLVKAELLRYEALKEILPDKMKDRLKSFEKEAGSFIKDIALELMSESIRGTESKEQEEPSKTVRKVNVDYI